MTARTNARTWMRRRFTSKPSAGKSPTLGQRWLRLSPMLRRGGYRLPCCATTARDAGSAASSAAGSMASHVVVDARYVLRDDRAEPFVVLLLEDFLELVREWWEGRGR